MVAAVEVGGASRVALAGGATWGRGEEARAMSFISLT
jgi:hypothetical protein